MDRFKFGKMGGAFAAGGAAGAAGKIIVTWIWFFFCY